MPETDSTNAEAARRAAQLTNPTWIRADEQTKGRGRSGRAWESLSGNLFATLVYRPKCSAMDAALRSFVIANALFDALAEFEGHDAVSLKWPNDVLLNGGKVAGILLESQSRGTQVEWLGIGVGVNLAVAPQPVGSAAFLPVSVPSRPGAASFLVRLAAAFAREELDFVTYGFSSVRERWLSRAARLGQPIIARTSKEEIAGVFQTVDEEGNLRIDTDQGPRVVSAADVFFG